MGFSPGRHTRVHSHFLLQGIFPTQRSKQDFLHCRQILYCLVNNLNFCLSVHPCHPLYWLSISIKSNWNFLPSSQDNKNLVCYHPNCFFRTILQLGIFPLSKLDCTGGFQKPDFPGGSEIKNLPANAGDTKDTGLIPESGISPGKGNGNSLLCSCLENSIDRGLSMWAAVHGVTKSEKLLEPIIQSEASQKEKHQYSILTHIYGI